MEKITTEEREKKFYSQVIKDNQSLDISHKSYVRVLFKNCRFVKVRGSQLINCTLQFCTLDPVDVRELVGFTATINCPTFYKCKLSPLALNCMLFLFSNGADPVEKARVRSVIPKQQVALFEKIYPDLEVPPWEAFAV